MIRERTFLLAFLLVPTLFIFQIFLTLPSSFAAEDSLSKGLYVNETYGYSLVIPQGLTGVRSPSPAPQHGIRIDLPSLSPEAAIWIDGEYDSAFLKSAEKVVKQHVSWLKETQKEVTILSSSKTRLGTLKALAIQIRYIDSKTSRPMKRDFICALTETRKKNELGIIYTVEMAAPEAAYFESKQILNQIVKKWTLSL